MERKETFNFNLSPEGDEIIIRHGEAQKPIPFRNGTQVTGNIDTVKRHLMNPSNRLTQGVIWEESEELIWDTPLAHSYVKVNRDKRMISFHEDVGMPWESTYTGELHLDPRFEKLKINTGESRTAHELADLLKMNRTLFETKDTAMRLVSELKNFKAKVDSQIEDMNDGRGNTKLLRSQAVESNVPESFRLTTPIFKGEGEMSIEVEIEIDSSDLSCRLISPEANDYLQDVVDSIIDDQLQEIHSLHPTLRIFEE